MTWWWVRQGRSDDADWGAPALGAWATSRWGPPFSLFLFRPQLPQVPTNTPGTSTLQSPACPSLPPPSIPPSLLLASRFVNPAQYSDPLFARQAARLAHRRAALRLVLAESRHLLVPAVATPNRTRSSALVQSRFTGEFQPANQPAASRHHIFGFRGKLNGSISNSRVVLFRYQMWME